MATEITKLTLPWKVRLTISILSAFSDISRRSNGTINRRLFSLIDRHSPPNPSPVHGVSSSDVTVDPTRNLCFRIFTPSSAAVTASTLPVFVYFHGGAFAFFSAASAPYDGVCRLYCRSLNAVVVSVDYRLAPEHRYPSPYDDGFDVLKFLDQNVDILPHFADVTKCFLAGDSAGANLAHHMAVRISKEKLRRVNVIGLVSVQPFLGGEERVGSEIRLTRVPVISLERTDWHWKTFLPNGSDRDHEAVNVSGPNAVDISGLDYPNTILITGGFDPMRDRQKKYYEWLRRSGKEVQLVDYPDTFHAFYLFPELPHTSMLMSQVNEFITKQMSNVN